MISQTEPEIVLYDLACIKGVCFSPVVWRIRMMLNYKRIPYRATFLEFPDIEPTLKALGLEPAQPASESMPKYTVPAIHHLSTNTYLMGSKEIAEFIESMYPERPILLESPHGNQIQAQARNVSRGPYLTSLMAREPSILSSRAQEFFRNMREAALNNALEAVADSGREEQAWSEAGKDLRALSDLIHTNHGQGPFVLGAQPSYADFFVAGSLQSARVIDEGVFNRMMKFDGFKDVYNACLPFMGKKD